MKLFGLLKVRWLNFSKQIEPSIVRHINNIYKTEELDRESTCAKIAQVQMEGKRKISRQIPYFNLDMIISVGYRVNCLSSGFVSDMSPIFWVLEILIYYNIYKKYGFIALRTKLFVLLHYRNRRYGNEYYDKNYRYEIF